MYNTEMPDKEPKLPEPTEALLKEVAIRGIKLFKQEKFPFVRHLKTLNKITDKNKKSLIDNLHKAFADAPVRTDGRKSILIYNPSIHKYQFEYIVVIADGNNFAILNNNDYRIPHLTILDENLDYIYKANCFSYNNVYPKMIQTTKFKYSDKDGLGVYIHDYKNRPCYAYKINDNYFHFDISGNPKIKAMEIGYNTITVTYHGSNYRKMVFDTNFNLKELKFSDFFYREIKKHISSKNMSADTFESIENLLAESFELISLTEDKDIKFTSKEVFEQQLAVLKEIYNKKEVFEIESEAISDLRDELSVFNTCIDALRDRNQFYNKPYFYHSISRTDNDMNCFFVFFDKLDSGFNPFKPEILMNIKNLDSLHNLSIPHKK